MNFHCQKCQTRYTIADDKIRGKVLKVRCRSCAALITVRDPTASGVHGSAPVPMSGYGAAAPGAPGPRPPASAGDSLRAVGKRVAKPLGAPLGGGAGAGAGAG
ncbi:MAG TPA: zinc-ribbon domain-containing protein, partial [Myxococcota bacterium]|nr:zinc-ribbon domain-containing protein [Myxococcota bacterium]